MSRRLRVAATLAILAPAAGAGILAICDGPMMATVAIGLVLLAGIACAAWALEEWQ